MILDKIVSNKRKEVSKFKETFPLSRFKSKLTKSNRSFAKAISAKGLNLIAEIKPASPSEGIISKRVSPSLIAKEYSDAGACAISVLTDTAFFGGCLDFIKLARNATKLPILRKDFIIDEYQVYQARYYSADAILLIATILSKEKLKKFISIASKYNMDCLVEVHNLDELKKAVSAGALIVGINNRNLKNMKIDINTTLKLVNLINGKIVVSESGFSKKSDINKVRGEVNAVLIGTTLMKSSNKKKKIKELFGKI